MTIEDGLRLIRVAGLGAALYPPVHFWLVALVHHLPTGPELDQARGTAGLATSYLAGVVSSIMVVVVVLNLPALARLWGAADSLAQALSHSIVFLVFSSLGITRGLSALAHGAYGVPVSRTRFVFASDEVFRTRYFALAQLVIAALAALAEAGWIASRL